MTLLADKDERFKGLFVKVSIFVLLALFGIALNFLYTSIRQGIFLHRSPVYFVSETGEDHKEGMPVKLSGFKIGSITDITLDEKARTRVEVMIEDKYLSLLKEDAVLTPKREGVIGDSILEVKRGSESKGPLRPGSEVRFERSGGLEQITQDLRERLFPAINDMAKLLHDANDPQGDIRQLLKNMRELSAGLNGTRARLDQLLEHTDTTIARDAQPMLQSLSKSAAQVEQDLPALLKKADTTLDNLQHSSAVIKSTLDASGPQVSRLVGESRELVSGARKTVDSLNNSWLLRSGIPPAEQPGLLKMDSND